MVDSKRKNRAGDPEPGSKRQRVSRACDQCRSAREKCDGIQPICFTCASSNRDCTYTTNPKRRGIQPGYIRTLELTLAWTLCNVPGSEEALLELLQQENGQLLISSTDSAASNKLHKKWRKHIVSKAIDRVLSGEGIADLFEHGVSTSGDDEEDENAPEATTGPVASLLTPESLKTGHAQFQSDHTILPTMPELPVQNMQEAHTDEATAHQMLQLPANHWRLIDVYFAYTHSWLPVTSKEQVLKLCYSYPKEGLQFLPGSSSADHAELWSILALASLQNRSTASPMGVSSLELLRTAESLCYTVVDDLDIGHVGAFLTLALINIGLQRTQLAWLLLGRAIRAGLWLRLDLTQQTSTSTRKMERLQALLLGCFVVETVLAIQLDAVPSLRSDLVRELDLIPEEGLDEWQPWTGCDGFQSSRQPARPTLPSQAKSTFNQLVTLCCILNDRIIERKYGQQTPLTSASLSNWLAKLPASLGPLHSMNLEQTSPQKLHLFLAFLVGRAYDSSNRATIEEALSVLDHFTYALGLSAMPPLFACFLTILKARAKDDGFQQNRLAGILTRFWSVWKHPSRDGGASVSPASIDLSTPDNDNVATPRPLTAANTNVNSMTSPLAAVSPQLQRTESIHVASPASAVLHPQPVQTIAVAHPTLPAPPQLYDDSKIRSYSVDQSMDLDALFDHFTAIEGTDQSASHPQFMQNLGFAPNVNFADLMTNEYGWEFRPG
ncbi:uncharacterized protein PV09_01109 [Verruconis gallopava]|uniref:Zn(2)-C6 fungal-type domain-containing protein n=1 Tax=Verruconis gallopava TaxID=253628 RepID=A0A0D2AN71_9PEZI|nr:uncharacterized protein PV09_01109 [Verruconis gallopava]KIW08178.1 hypothetical protein PV09_01109 [Verruconis gallopava]